MLELEEAIEQYLAVTDGNTSYTHDQWYRRQQVVKALKERRTPTPTEATDAVGQGDAQVEDGDTEVGESDGSTGEEQTSGDSDNAVGEVEEHDDAGVPAPAPTEEVRRSSRRINRK